MTGAMNCCRSELLTGSGFDRFTTGYMCLLIRENYLDFGTLLVCCTAPLPRTTENCPTLPHGISIRLRGRVSGYEHGSGSSVACSLP